MWIESFIEIVFSLGLFVNAALFIPQIIQLYKVKNSEGFSLLTFSGFNVIQLFMLLHGVLHRDYLLVFGIGLSLITCGMVTLMIVLYKK